MSGLKKLITEIHHRSLWQVLLIYCGAALVAYQSVQALTEGLGLPPWFPAFAIVLFIIGLPIVLATAFVHEVEPPKATRAELTDLDVAQVEAETIAARREAQRRHRFLTWRNAVASFVVALAVWGIVATGWMLFGRRADQRAAAGDRPSVAVLPFANRSGLHEDEYFTDGIHDEILSQLYKISGLSVRGRTSVMQYRDSPKNLRKISRELNARFLLEGGVQRVGDTVRINLQLIEAERDEHVWAESYDRPLSVENLLSVQSEVARRVAEALRATITGEESERIERRPTGNLEAYDYYLRGLYASDRRMTEQMYQSAVELDPGFALAYAALSYVHTEMYYQSDDPTQERLAKARAAADRALELDPDSPEAHIALGCYFLFGIRAWNQAMDELAIALRLNPNHAEANYWMGALHMRRGEFELAVTYRRKALELDPRSPRMGEGLANIYLWLRDFEAAESLWESNIALDPGRGTPYVWKAWTHLNQEGGWEKARQVLERGRERTGIRLLGLNWAYWAQPLLRSLHDFYRADLRRQSPETAGLAPARLYRLKALSYHLTDEAEASRAYFDSARVRLEQIDSEWPDAEGRQGLWAVVYAGLGRKAEAIREARADVEQLPVSRDHFLGPSRVARLAEVYRMVGEYDAAIDQLEYLLSIPCPISPPLLRVDPLWDPLRDHPRFQALLEKYEQ